MSAETSRIGQAGAFFKSLGDPLFDTATPTGRLLSTLLAAIAEFERELIRERTGEGGKPKAPGVRFGRPSVRERGAPYVFLSSRNSSACSATTSFKSCASRLSA